jgi:molybdate/tungstate transport system permease protein
MMMAYNPHTISIQIFEDNAIGGLEQAVSGIILLLLLAVMIMVVFYISGTKWHEVISLRRSENSKS